MVTDREKLVELIDEVAEGMIFMSAGEQRVSINSDDIADHLIANGVTVNNWRDAKTDPPMQDGQYLVFICCEEGEWIETDEFDTTSKIWRSVDAYHENATEFVTHWQPQPEPPKEVQKNV